MPAPQRASTADPRITRCGQPRSAQEAGTEPVTSRSVVTFLSNGERLPGNCDRAGPVGSALVSRDAQLNYAVAVAGRAALDGDPRGVALSRPRASAGGRD